MRLVWWSMATIVGLLALPAEKGAAVSGSTGQVRLIAHRGVWRHAAENSVPALQAAIDLGLAYCELDVRTTADGVLVNRHNSDLTTPAGVKRKINQMTWAELAQCDLGGGQRVPRIDDEFRLGRGKIGFYLDCKDVKMAQLVEMLQHLHLTTRVLLHADLDECREVQRLNPDIPLLPAANNVQEVQQLYDALHPQAIELRWLTFTEAQADLCHRLGITAGTSFSGGRGDKPEDLRRALAAGLTYIETDEPEMCLEVLGRSR